MSNAVDGNLGTMAHTGNSANAFIRVRVQTPPADVTRVVVFNRLEHSERMVGCSVILRNAGLTEVFRSPQITTVENVYTVTTV